MTTDGLLSHVTSKIHQGLCGLHGHDSLLHFDQGHISLLCTSCGHQSPGWEFGGTAAKRRAATTASTAPASRPTGRRLLIPFVGARKVA
jgi:hypothetical protein